MRTLLQLVSGLALAGLSSALLLAAPPAEKTATAKSQDSSLPTFTGTVQPFLQKNCMVCHNAKAKVAGLNLEALANESTLVDKRETWEAIARRVKAAEMPPKAIPRPKPIDVLTFTKYLEDSFEQMDAKATPQAGRVTARRLNKAEYNNTIHDLLAVNLTPADDFPQDDSGYGFDNIGDVLSLSPVLMEKYLNAAEQVTRTAMFGPAPRKPSMSKLQAARSKVTPMNDVPAEYDATGLTMPNAFATTYKFPVDADYDVRVRMTGFRPVGSNPIEVTAWLDGKPQKSVAVAGGHLPESFPWHDDFDGKTVTVRIHSTAGEHMLAVAIPHLFDGLPAKFKGPNPSEKPSAPEPDFEAFVRKPRSMDPMKVAQYKVRLSEAIKSYKQINSVRVANVEMLGPFGQDTKPSLASLKRIYVCGHYNGKHNASCPRLIVSSFARRAFRRPVTVEEVNRYLRLMTESQKDGSSFEEALSVSLEAILVSPDFLFRIENGGSSLQTASNEPRRISQYELASRLSYFLWSSMPDEELMRAAGNGTLRKPEVLKAQVMRMLKDKRSFALAENFGGQWLQFRALESVKPDHDIFPAYDDYLRLSMEKETELFIYNVIHEDRSILDLIDGKYTFINERMADFYGMPGIKGPEFRRVDLSNMPERGGVITQASVLTVSSYATRTSPVLRGKWILENILNDPPPPPPPGVPNLKTEDVGTTVSLRTQMEAHRANAMCASCHQKMDPLGFGLENFNAIGQWRTVDGNFTIDSSGTLPSGKTFQGAEGLKATLMDNKDIFARCLAEKLMTYALGRGVERYDRPTLKAITTQMAANDYRFSSLVLGIVNSMPFQMQQDPPSVPAKKADKIAEAPAKTDTPLGKGGGSR